MEKIAIIVCLLGTFTLLALMFQEPQDVNVSEIGDLRINSKIIIQGYVNSERTIGDRRIMVIDGLDIVCECSSYLKKQVIIEGIVQDYRGKKQVNVLQIRER